MAESAQSHLIWMLISATAGMLILVVGAVSFFFSYQSRLLRERMKNKKIELYYQRAMVDAIINSQESERKKIAANIHDNLSGSLFMTQLNILDLKESLSLHGIFDFEVKFENALKLLEYSIDSAKQIAWDLVPVSLAITGLGGSIRDYCGRIKITGLKISFSESGISGDVSDNVQLNVYRIVQELLSNSLKHSGATQISIKLSWYPSMLIVDYSNNGIHFVFPSSTTSDIKGLGVLNIYGRLSILDASVIDPKTDSGFNFTFKVRYE